MMARFTDWYRKNAAWFTLAFGVIAIADFLASNYHVAHTAGNKLSAFLEFVHFDIAWISVTILALTAIGIGFYLVRHFTHQSFRREFLVGVWLNEWSYMGNTNAEIVEITEEMRYCFTDGQPLFRITDIVIDAQRQEIRFTKISLQRNDTRHLRNVLKIESNKLLTGMEEQFPIRYTKLGGRKSEFQQPKLRNS